MAHMANSKCDMEFWMAKASPIYDVTIAILLSVFIYLLNKYKKFG